MLPNIAYMDPMRNNLVDLRDSANISQLYPIQFAKKQQIIPSRFTLKFPNDPIG